MKIRIPIPFSGRSKEIEPDSHHDDFGKLTADGGVQDPMEAVRSIWARSNTPREDVVKEMQKQFPRMDAAGIGQEVDKIMRLRVSIEAQKKAKEPGQ